MNIVMVPFHDYKKWLFEGFRTRDAHLCQHFEKNDAVEKILVVNRPTSKAEKILKKTDWKTPSDNVVYCKNNVQLSKMSRKVWCIDFYIPDFLKVACQKKMWWFTAFGYENVIREINNAIEYLDMKDSVLLLQNPMAIGTAKGVNKKLFVFDAIDNWLYHPQMSNKTLIRENYAFADKNADLILTVSEALKNIFPSNENVHWIPNGVEVEYFSRAVKKEKPDDKPVIGYIGKIQDRVDFDLVEKCLCRYPNAQFEFLGPIYSQAKRIAQLEKKYSNISFKGDIHYSKLPDSMKHFDISIIPHKVDDFTSSMNPLKLYEYLAAGKMVVTTSVAGTENISSYVYSANDDAFVENIGKALSDIQNDSVHVQDIIESIPKECFWERRVTDILSLFIKQMD